MLAYWCIVVYRSVGYFDAVSEATEASMGLAVHEIEELPQYRESGEVSRVCSTNLVVNTHNYIQWVITDARCRGTCICPF